MITLALGTYAVQCTHMVEGYDCEIEVQAIDLGDALDRVESGGVFAANDARVISDE